MIARHQSGEDLGAVTILSERARAVAGEARKIRRLIDGTARLFDVGRPSRDRFGLRQALRPVARTGLRIADGLGEHLAQLSLGPGRLARV